MALPKRVFIEETQELFNSVQEAADELGYAVSPLSSHLSGKKLLAIGQFLTIYTLPCEEVCKKCGIELTDQNTGGNYRQSHTLICKSCDNKRISKNKKERKNKMPWLRDGYAKAWIKHLLIEQSGYCVLCGETLDYEDFHVDHIMPKSRGGGNNLDNLELLCSKCNRSKFDMTPEEYIKHCIKVVNLDINS